MSARIHVPPERLTGELVELSGAEHRHLVRVLRVRPGDAIGVFDGLGSEIDATVHAVGARTITLRLHARRRLHVGGARITLVQVVPRPERMDWIVEKTTELGVTTIAPVLTERSPVAAREAAPGGDAVPSGKLARWRKIAREAARQCGRADVPELREPAPLPAALDALDADAPPGATPRRLVLWETGAQPPLFAQLDPGDREVQLVVGPEGGLSEAQVELLRAHGFTPAGLGPRILRCETAAVVAVALAAAVTGGLAPAEKASAET